MRKEAYVLRDDGSVCTQEFPTNNSLKDTVVGLKQDATEVGSALCGFPYNSALKIIGLVTVLYVSFKIVGKFVNIEDRVKRLFK